MFPDFLHQMMYLSIGHLDTMIPWKLKGEWKQQSNKEKNYHATAHQFDVKLIESQQVPWVAWKDSLEENG